MTDDRCECGATSDLVSTGAVDDELRPVFCCEACWVAEYLTICGEV
jgi:hypothetical protein